MRSITRRLVQSLESVEKARKIKFVIVCESGDHIYDVPHLVLEGDKGLTEVMEAITERMEAPVELPGIEFDLEAIYVAYPKKVGKKKGLTIAQKKIKTVADYEAVLGAVNRYRQEVVGRDPKYIKHFDSFMNNWEDYAAPVEHQEEFKGVLV